MKRIPEVVDCWVESGSMPFAAKHYPMENKDWFKENFPAQFITEYIAQTRTWFYYTHALSVILFGSNAFENVLTTGSILAEDGSKMSKSKKNFPDPQKTLDTYGADALRLYMMGSPLMKAEDLNFAEEGVNEMLRKVVLTFENIVSFYELFKGDFKPQGTLIMDIEHQLDQWLVMRVDETIESATKSMDSYAVSRAVQDIEELLRDMSQWYVRRSRERFKGDDVLDKEQAIAVLGESILATIKMLAPLAPFLAERTYQIVLGEDKLYESVHLDEWPKTFKSKHKSDVKMLMQEARDIVEAVHATRSEAGIKVRQPLSEMQAFTEKSAWKGSDELKKIILDEVNVRKFNTLDSLDDYDAYEQTIGKKKVGSISIALNLEITEELKREGWVREFVRHINNMRKEKGFTIHDKATITYSTDNPAMKKTINEFKLNIERQILGTLEFKEKIKGTEIKIDDAKLTINIEKNDN
jgi:isoleucyl-tRNA synthetase